MHLIMSFQISDNFNFLTPSWFCECWIIGCCKNIFKFGNSWIFDRMLNLKTFSRQCHLILADLLVKTLSFEDYNMQRDYICIDKKYVISRKQSISHQTLRKLFIHFKLSFINYIYIKLDTFCAMSKRKFLKYNTLANQYLC